MQSIESHRDLAVWQLAISLAVKVYAVTRGLPSDEQHGLQAHLRRAAVSIPCSIAEGAARGHRLEFIRCLQSARSSLSEVETQLIVALRHDLVAHDTLPLDDVVSLGHLINDQIQKLIHCERHAHAAACLPLQARPTSRRPGSEPN